MHADPDIWHALCAAGRHDADVPAGAGRRRASTRCSCSTPGPARSPRATTRAACCRTPRACCGGLADPGRAAHPLRGRHRRVARRDGRGRRRRRRRRLAGAARRGRARVGPGKALQGNLDPALLFAGPDVVDARGRAGRRRGRGAPGPHLQPRPRRAAGHRPGRAARVVELVHAPTSRLHAPRVVVVGGGITGLAAAFGCAPCRPDDEIVVLEAARPARRQTRRRVELAGHRSTPAPRRCSRAAPRRRAGRGAGARRPLVHPGPPVRAAGRRPHRAAAGRHGAWACPAIPTSPRRALAGRRRRAARRAARRRGSPAATSRGRAACGAPRATRWSTGSSTPCSAASTPGRADELGVRATIPALAAASTPTPARCSPPRGRACRPRPSRARRRSRSSARCAAGIADLPATLALAARAELRLGRTVTALARTATGWRAEFGEDGAPRRGRRRRARGAPARRAPPARRPRARGGPSPAGEIELGSSALVLLALPAAAAAPLAGRSGVLVGAGERRPDGLPWTIKAATFSSEKWPHLAPARRPRRHRRPAPLGRPARRPRSLAALRRDDDDLVSAARDDLAALTGIEVVPAETAVVRWPGGLPQYGVGHVERVAAIEDGVAGLPGLAVAGAALHGVGVPACLATADAAAQRIAAHLAASTPRCQQARIGAMDDLAGALGARDDEARTGSSWTCSGTPSPTCGRRPRGVPRQVPQDGRRAVRVLPGQRACSTRTSAGSTTRGSTRPRAACGSRATCTPRTSAPTSTATACWCSTSTTSTRPTSHPGPGTCAGSWPAWRCSGGPRRSPTPTSTRSTPPSCAPTSRPCGRSPAAPPSGSSR